MTVLIGITQEPEKTAQYFTAKYEKAQETMAIVGPFTSAEEASDWIEYIKARSEAYEHVLNSKPLMANKYWYGYTCQCVEAKEISLHIRL